MTNPAKYTDVLKPEQISIKLLWNTFAAVVLPRDAGPVQRAEMQKAFYAGFTECFKVMTDLSSTLTEEQSMAVLDRLNGEAREFYETMLHEYREAYER